MGITMPSERTIQGRGVLECAGRTTAATYTLILDSDHLGYPNVTGLLLDADIAFAFALDPSLSESLGRLRLEDNQEITVFITPRDDGSLLVQSSGAIPDILTNSSAPPATIHDGESDVEPTRQ